MNDLQNIFDDCGLNVQGYEQVHGGDINQAYCLNTVSDKYFLKVNERDKFPLMFEKEAKGLELLRKNCSLIIPQVIRSGVVKDEQYLILEWLEKGRPAKNMWEEFGRAMALLHKQQQDYFGSEEDNYIGSLKQLNSKHSTWEVFFTECRLIPVLKYLDIDETNCIRLASHFPDEPPSLLHGDLWAGNYLIHISGYAAIYDPAVYSGHREMDIGMTKLFGGFDKRFYDAYNEIYPLESDWQQRLPLAQLYPILVHAVLFGGHYISRAREIMRYFL